MEWKKQAAKILLLKPMIKKFLVSSVLKAVGVTGGFWAWLVGIFVSKGLKKIGQEITKGAELADAKKEDDENAAKYKKVIDEGGTTDEKIKSELDVLNGGKP